MDKKDIYPIDTIVSLKKTGEFARIVQIQYLLDGQNFLHYLGEIEGREGLWALYHDDLYFEAPSAPKKSPQQAINIDGTTIYIDQIQGITAISPTETEIVFKTIVEGENLNIVVPYSIDAIKRMIDESELKS